VYVNCLSNRPVEFLLVRTLAFLFMKAGSKIVRISLRLPLDACICADKFAQDKRFFSEQTACYSSNIEVPFSPISVYV
jgi:hypothetical protein